MLSMPSSSNMESLSSFRAWLFDMDGVITDTARVHAKAWKTMFDDFLRIRSENNNEPYVEFTLEGDYHRYVDGKPRYEGVDSFLKSRGIELPWGDSSDAPGHGTVCALGNQKNKAFNDVLAQDGATVFQTTVSLIHQLFDMGKSVAVVTSSKNCDGVLKSAGLDDLLKVRVDGNLAAEKKLPGKPQADTYLEAAKLLGASAAESIVIEDAISGVQAGRNGQFGCVIGVDRFGDGSALIENGADIAVSDLEEIKL